MLCKAKPPSLKTGDFADDFIDNSKSTRNSVLTFHVTCCISYSHAYVFLDWLEARQKHATKGKKILHAFLRKWVIIYSEETMEELRRTRLQERTQSIFFMLKLVTIGNLSLKKIQIFKGSSSFALPSYLYHGTNMEASE